MAAEGRLKRKTSIHGPANCQKPIPSLRLKGEQREGRRVDDDQQLRIGPLGERHAQAARGRRRRRAPRATAAAGRPPHRWPGRPAPRPPPPAGPAPTVAAQERASFPCLARAPHSAVALFLRGLHAESQARVAPAGRAPHNPDSCPKGVLMAAERRIAFAILATFASLTALFRRPNCRPRTRSRNRPKRSSIAMSPVRRA